MNSLLAIGIWLQPLTILLLAVTTIMNGIVIARLLKTVKMQTEMLTLLMVWR